MTLVRDFMRGFLAGCREQFVRGANRSLCRVAQKRGHDPEDLGATPDERLWWVALKLRDAPGAAGFAARRILTVLRWPSLRDLGIEHLAPR